MATYIVCDGDSMTAGFDSTVWDSYPLKLALLYPASQMVSVVNVGTSGETLADMLADADDEVDPCYDARKGNNYTVIWGGTNDMYLGPGGDFTGQGAYDRLATYCQARQAVGEKVIVLTCLPRNNPELPGGYQTERNTFNSLIRANWSTFADALVDVAADSRLDDYSDLTYFKLDMVHLNATGRGVVAALVKAALDGLGG
jgi:lysophospholipase L1-like esterase